MAITDKIKTIIKKWLWAENENNFYIGTTKWNENERDISDYTREEMVRTCLDAWRYSPIARRIIEINTEYSVGKGFNITAEKETANKTIKEFINNPYNLFEEKIYELSDELSRAGNLFILFNIDNNGNSYIRAIPSENIKEIITDELDQEQELEYVIKSGEEEESISSYRQVLIRNGALNESFITHYTINKPVGANWGESDLTPIIKWIWRYQSFVEDRIRLNKYRNAFLYVIKANFASAASRNARQEQLTKNPPSAGSIIVTDETEEWSVISPKLEALDAQADSLIIKKLIAIGAGLPLHYLAEPESSTRTTAESASEATHKRLESRQRKLIYIIEDILKKVLEIKNNYNKNVDKDSSIIIKARDITKTDNLNVAKAGREISEIADSLLDRGMITEEEYKRLVYKYIDEESEDGK